MTETTASLTFTYTGMAQPGTMDQTLDIEHSGRDPIAPSLEIEALDDGGEVLPDITVRSASGSTAGELVSSPDTTSTSSSSTDRTVSGSPTSA